MIRGLYADYSKLYYTVHEGFIYLLGKNSESLDQDCILVDYIKY